MLKASIVAGTRPELVKLAPLIRTLRQIPSQVESDVIGTSQHPERLEATAKSLAVPIDVWLAPPYGLATLEAMLPALINTIGDHLSQRAPDVVVVQGDTTSALAGALAASQLGLPVAHIEAGLRSGDRYRPFPEEINRKIISQIACLHFAPTAIARRNLLREDIAPQSIMVTGNTGVDSLLWALDHLQVPHLADPSGRDDGADGPPLILVTCHRRESWNEALENICLALGDILDAFPAARAVFILPGNPNLHQTIRGRLATHPRVTLQPALDYPDFLNLLARASLVMTDSGGIQEEVPSLRTPCVVMRQETDRPEIASVPYIRLAGTGRQAVVGAALELLTLGRDWALDMPLRNPFGDGHAAGRIAEALIQWHQGADDPLDPVRQFFDPLIDGLE